MKASLTIALAIGSAVCSAVTLARADQTEKASAPTAAVAVLAPTNGHKTAGVVQFVQHDGYVQVSGKVEGLSPGKHGFHIHQFGDLRAADGTSAGGHFNPTGTKHGGPNDAQHHAGDLGNIVANREGVATVDLKAKGLSVSSIIGRALVVHAGTDDLVSQPSGNAGPRAAVGVIGLANAEASAAK